MADSLFFYDLETSGLDPRQARIMQFAGQRTDLNLKLVGEPFNFLVKLSSDVLPSPEAVILTGITPQMTLADGLNEAEFTKIFNHQIATNDTTFVGYNNVRFDDEFIRYTNYRNFFDPYEWHYKDGKKRWDLLDVVRMSRALRPEGIKWPLDKDKLPTNRLTDITKANGIDHKNAHDAYGDVTALIKVAKLIKSKQPKLFDYLCFVMTDKNEVESLLNTNLPVVYTFGAYSGHPQKTTVVVQLANLKDGGILVYDLRQDPKLFAKLPKDKLKIVINREDEATASPFFVIKANKCPAVAPLSVLDKSSETNIGLDKLTINKHLVDFKKYKQKLGSEAAAIFNEISAARSFISETVDSELYDSFFDRSDSDKLSLVRDVDPALLNKSEHIFSDRRLNELVFLYKARNYPKVLDSDEVVDYEQYRQKLLFDGGPNSRFSKFLSELERISSIGKSSANRQYLIEELRLYAESIVPSEV